MGDKGTAGICFESTAQGFNCSVPIGFNDVDIAKALHISLKILLRAKSP